MENIFCPDFLFFNDEPYGEMPAWKDTVAALNGEQGKDAALIRHIVSFAAEFSLSGNLWQHWLTWILMTHENACTLACERKTIKADSALEKLVRSDFESFRMLFHQDFNNIPGMVRLSSLISYDPPFAPYEPNFAGELILDLSKKLAGAEDDEAFSAIMEAYYRNHGAGIYGIYKAFRITGAAENFRIVPVADSTDVCFDDLIGLEEQKKTLRANTEAFLNGGHANNVLLYGDSGTGKSTSVHALMHDYFDKGLRLVELSKQDRKMLPQVLAEIKKRNYHFIIFLDDLSFEENESDYKELKAMLEGALETRSDRVLIYATSNRRHLIRETWNDRKDMEYQDDIHHSDTMEEKLSLASRFGVTIYYPKPVPKEYLEIVRELCSRSGLEIGEKELNDLARKWELRHGGMTGRAASQLITWLQGNN